MKTLKDAIKKLLDSKGEKKFFFAYGAGKRKDNNGEGELSVHGKKPAKKVIEDKLASCLVNCNDVFEGVCWTGNRPENNETVYFQGKGKKLADGIITRMVKTAHKTVGRKYDFQLPSAEEEARATKLAEAEAEAVPGAAPAAAPPPPPDEARVGVVKRLNALTAGVKAALNGPDAARIQTLLMSVNGL